MIYHIKHKNVPQSEIVATEKKNLSEYFEEVNITSVMFLLQREEKDGEAYYSEITATVGALKEGKTQDEVNQNFKIIFE